MTEQTPSAETSLAAYRGYVLTGTVDVIRGLTDEYQTAINALIEAVPGKKDEIVAHAREVLQSAYEAIRKIIEAS